MKRTQKTEGLNTEVLNTKVLNTKALGSYGVPVRRGQSGAILIVCMVMLLLVTVIGVGTMDVTTREVKMAVAMQDSDLAFEAAELALNEAECWIAGGLDAGDTDCGPASRSGGAASLVLGVTSKDGTSGVWEEKASIGESRAWWLEKDADWWASNGFDVGGRSHGGLSGLSDNPRYVIELLSTGGGAGDSLVAKATENSGAQTYYRVTARGVGARESTVVLLQSTYGLR